MIVCLNFKCKNKQNLWERERFFWFKVVQGVDCDTFFQNCHGSDKVNLSGEDGATFGALGKHLKEEITLHIGECVAAFQAAAGLGF